MSHHLITSCAHASLKPCVAVKLFYFQRIDKISYTDEFSLQSSLICLNLSCFTGYDNPFWSSVPILYPLITFSCLMFFQGIRSKHLPEMSQNHLTMEGFLHMILNRNHLANICLSWRRLGRHVLKTPWGHVLKTSWRHLLKKFSLEKICVQGC